MQVFNQPGLGISRFKWKETPFEANPNGFRQKYRLVIKKIVKDLLMSRNRPFPAPVTPTTLTWVAPRGLEGRAPEVL